MLSGVDNGWENLYSFPHAERKHSYNIQAYSDKLEPGEYRIATNYINVHDSGNYDAYNIFANFTVK